MAEGGSEENKNPFSFRNYMQKQSNKKTDSSEHSVEDDLRANEDNSLNTRPATHRPSDDNPFSFRRFLNSQSTTRGTLCSANSSHSAHVPLKTLDLANDLPDFVQDHCSVGASNFELNASVQRDVPFTSVVLPDFTRDVDMVAENHHHNNSLERRSPNSFSLRSSQRHVRDNNLLDFPNEIVADAFMLNEPNGTNEPLAEIIPQPDVPSVSTHVCELPDFLPVGALNGHCVDLDEDVNNESALSTNELRELIIRLRTENDELQNHLLECRRNSSDLRSQNQQLNDELVRLKKKELEDTTALENMVKQVEANLTAATSRAVKAEKVASKLQDELKALQFQNKQLERENELLAGGENSVRSLKEKATYASQQIAFAATNAEELLRQLLKGVDGLKLISDMLTSIDKVTTKQDDSTRFNDAHEGASGGS